MILTVSLPLSDHTLLAQPQSIPDNPSTHNATWLCDDLLTLKAGVVGPILRNPLIFPYLHSPPLQAVLKPMRSPHLHSASPHLRKIVRRHHA